MPNELSNAIKVLRAMDNPVDAPFSHELVISMLLDDPHNMDMSDAHTVLCVASDRDWETDK